MTTYLCVPKDITNYAEFEDDEEISLQDILGYMREVIGEAHDGGVNGYEVIRDSSEVIT